ncbi:MAG: VWA domain-containing protein [Verrucomicrobia subdivision 3 bacterium]|nr:VWA domain-containing protein [Limisphaerales bacterium]
MRRFAIPILGMLLLIAVFISGCSKQAKPAANPRLEKSGQSLTAEPVVPVAKDSSETVAAEGEEIEAGNEPAPESDPAPVLSRAEMEELVRRAKAGDANAQVDLGNLFFEGRGADVNKAAAEYWWKLAARNRHPVAMANLNMLRAKPEEGVSFFGTASRGNKFVFIIDKSYSMSGNRLAGAKKELCATLKGLKPTDQFMIYFFSDGAQAMPARAMLAGTPKNINWAIDWVRGRSVDGGTNPTQALQWCFNLKPDTVWLLTDGQFSDGPPLDAIAAGNRQLKARINTLAFHDKAGADILQRIARENDGTYRFVKP